MKIVCDSCATKYSISDDKVRGKVFKIRCKKCSHIIVVRGTADASAPAPAAAAPEGGGWHIVIEGEQVGPLPEAEIRARLSRGEINADTYIWKEGFADWLKLAAVPEFADLVAPSAGEASGSVGINSDFFGDGQSSAARPAQEEADDGFGHVASGGSGRNGGLFAAVDAASSKAAGNSPDANDAFAAPAASRGGGGGDLFSAHVAAPYAGEESRRSSAGGANHDGGRVENLTAQRHENSVLFSLANLQSLAMPSGGAAAKAAAAAAASSNASGGGSSDGSGLIDIRAMAATTLGTPSSDSRSGGGGFGDDLPAFGSFSAAAPVLLPMPSSSGTPKWIYFAIAAMALLIVGFGLMAYKILNTKPVTVAAPVAPSPMAAPAPVAAPAAAAPAVAPAAPSAPAIADENLPPREGAAKEGEPKHEKGSGKHGKHEKKGAAAADSGGKSAGPSAPVASAAPEADKKPQKGSLDDLLEGALSGKKAKARASSSSSDDDSPRKGSSDSASAGPLAKGAVVSGMNGVKPKVAECYNQFKVPGMAMVSVVIGKSGKVTSATVTGKFAGTPTGGCVEKAVKSASFPPSDGLSTPYPFSLR
jgi:predicted Zn finger-like uncharacterized protein